jgi:hypothetical protein
MKTNLKIFFLSLLILNLSIPLVPFAGAYSDYELNAFNLTFDLNIPSDKTNDIHFDYDTRLTSYDSLTSYENEDGQTVFKALAHFELTLNLFTAYSAIDVYNDPIYQEKALTWATIITADEYDIPVASIALALLVPLTAPFVIAEAANNDDQTRDFVARYYDWNLDSGIKNLGWDGPLGFDIDIADLTPGELDIVDVNGNPITITQNAFESNIVDIHVGESKTYDIGTYFDHFLNAEDTLGGISINDIRENADRTPEATETSIEDFSIGDIGDLFANEIENEFDAYDLGVNSGSIELASTLAYGSQGATRPPTQGATITNGFIDFTLKPHVQPYQQTLYYTDNPILIFDTEDALFQTSAGFQDASLVVHSRKNRIVGWHVYNKVIQSKINVVAEIYSTCNIDANLGGSGDDLGIPDFQLEDIFWNLVFQGDDEAIVTFKTSPFYAWLQTYGPWIIGALVLIGVLYFLGPIIPQLMSASASKAIKKWGEK